MYVYPCKPQFYYIKWGLRGAKLYWYVCVISDYRNGYVPDTMPLVCLSGFLLLWLPLYIFYEPYLYFIVVVLIPFSCFPLITLIVYNVCTEPNNSM